MHFHKSSILLACLLLGVVHGDRFVYRLSNNGETTWRPSVAEVHLYSDMACQNTVAGQFISESSHYAISAEQGPGNLAFDDVSTTLWRPGCHPCTTGTAWLQFSTTTELMCVSADNLGKGTSGSGWDVGIKLEKETSGAWSTVFESTSGNVARYGSTAVELSHDGSQIVSDIGEDAFNARFAECPIVQYYRNGAMHSIYKRITDIPADFNAYKIFTDTWRSFPSNVLNEDFEIYSSLPDLMATRNRWQYCDYNDDDVGYPRNCGRENSVFHKWFSMPGGEHTIVGITSGAAFKFLNECPTTESTNAAFWDTCRWQTAQDPSPPTDTFMGWTCRDNEILTGFGLTALDKDITKIQCCSIGGHSSVMSNTCSLIDVGQGVEHGSAICGDDQDHKVFSGAYDKRANPDTVDAYTEILAGKCCEVECDAGWCAGNNWGVDKTNCEVVSVQGSVAQELVCPIGTLLTEIHDDLHGFASGIQKVGSVTCCTLHIIAEPTLDPTSSPSRTPSTGPTVSPSKAPTTTEPTVAPSLSPSRTPSVAPTVAPTKAPTSIGDCLLQNRRTARTDEEYLRGLARCLPSCDEVPQVRRALEGRLLQGGDFY